MIRLRLLPAVVAGMTLMIPAAFASPVILETGFDSAEFSAGDLNSQNGWTVIQGTATVQSTTIFEGDQAVSLAANTIVDQTATDPGPVVWTETQFRGAGTDQTPSYPADPPASAIVHFSSGGNIQGGLNGPGIFLADGDGSGAINWAATSISSVDANTWYQVTIRQDYSAQTWDCYVNGVLESTGPLGFRDNSVTQLNGFRQYSGVQSFMDSFVLRRPSPFDLDGDGDVDSADVVTNVNLEGQSRASLGPIAFSDADNNDDGVINNADVTSTVNQILGL